MDPFGLSVDERGTPPTVLEAAYMAKHIYNATDGDILKDLGTNYFYRYLI